MTSPAEAYQKLNRSFRKTLIFHTGVDSGFFAEYTYMINAMLYCLQHRIQFKLYSADANFGYDKGWTDYFLPFCEEVTEPFHRKHNIHTVPKWKNILATSYKQKSARFVRWKIKTIFIDLRASFIALKSYRRWVRLNHSVRFNPNRHFHIPELAIDGDYMHAFNALVDVTFRLNPETTAGYKQLTDRLDLSSPYIGCQVRGGDKVIETDLLPPEYYVRLMKGRIEHQTVFVLTDDYTIFCRLQALSPDTRWVTLCAPDERGYVNSAFVQTGNQHKKEQMVRFLASMKTLLNAAWFVGSITTGPSLFLLKKLYPNVLPADCAFDDFKQAITLPVTERGEVMQKYVTSQS